MKLLLPYAHDINGNLVHIDDAQKGQKYTCPNCGVELLLKISKIPEGQKYHRRNHFAHKGNSDNHCSESFLHKFFKERCVEFIKEKISAQEELFLKWKCKKCRRQHELNLLGQVVDIVPEYNLDVCRPDIALLDKNNKPIFVIEVVVTHRPNPEVLKYYENHNVVCFLIKVNDFSCCENIEDKLSHLDTDSMIYCIALPDKLRYSPESRSQLDSSYIDLIRFLEEKGNKTCKKCGGALKIATEEGVWERPCLKCENSDCDYMEKLSDYECVIFPNMK